MKQPLQGKLVAILVADGFEQSELVGPQQALEDAGASTEIIAPKEGNVKGWEEDHWGRSFKVDRPLAVADAKYYDALLLPGGVMNPDKLRANPRAVQFVRAFFTDHKPVAAICHGPWTLINAGVVRGRKLTSYKSIQEDLKNAGADWVDAPVVVDNRLVTSRKPADIPAFNEKFIEIIGNGVPGETRVAATGHRPVGQILRRSRGLGTVTQRMVTHRAEELAWIAGRTKQQVTATDRAQARRELTGKPRRPVSENVQATRPWSATPASGRRRRRPLRPSDDRNTKLLVEQGVAEATHDQMLLERRSRRHHKD